MIFLHFLKHLAQAAHLAKRLVLLFLEHALLTALAHIVKHPGITGL